VHDELTGLDPPPHRSSRDVETIGDLGDREEFYLIVAVPATTNMAESSRFPIAVATGLGLRGHAGLLLGF